VKTGNPVTILAREFINRLLSKNIVYEKNMNDKY
jgi:hypothetical protein